MRIIVTGGTGFIGTALTISMLAEGHQVWILTRNLQTARLAEGARGVAWDGRTTSGWGELVSQMDAIVNLTGQSLGSGPWTGARKNRILSSRVEAGKAISAAIHQASPRPKVLIQASAVGFYGPHGDEPVTEGTAPGHGFLAEVCKAWEASSQTVEEAGVRRVVIRTGVVLSRKAGALQRMLLPFRLFIGGPLGNGRQGLPWIHPADEVAGIRFLMENEKAQGVFNLSTPEPLSNADFGRILAKVMRRPYWLPVPAFALHLLLGEMSTLVLEGQYILPRRLLELGFRFRFETAEAALRDLLTG
ncbi:MAG: TIGR01777 family oxidoreductase [Chloroflexi bacterium]|nr:TIGR01777 family oxidoreductase [Chloroflexota bacterium]